MIVNFIEYEYDIPNIKYLVFDFKGECAGFDFDSFQGSLRVSSRDRIPLSGYNKKATIWLKSSQ